MQGLDGLKVLVAEDEGLVAMLIEDMLEDLGCELVGSAASVQEALVLVAQGGFGFALLDVNLAGQKVDPVAEMLLQKGVPFAFASGYGAPGVGEGFRGVPTLQKPFRTDDLARAIREALGGGGRSPSGPDSIPG
jgi:CheY-like chemotaxis protein